MSKDNTIGCINFGPLGCRQTPDSEVNWLEEAESVEEIIARLYGIIETLRETLAAAVMENNRLLEELRSKKRKRRSYQGTGVIYVRGGNPPGWIWVDEICDHIWDRLKEKGLLENLKR